MKWLCVLCSPPTSWPPLGPEPAAQGGTFKVVQWSSSCNVTWDGERVCTLFRQNILNWHEILGLWPQTPPPNSLKSAPWLPTEAFWAQLPKERVAWGSRCWEKQGPASCALQFPAFLCIPSPAPFLRLSGFSEASLSGSKGGRGSPQEEKRQGWTRMNGLFLSEHKGGGTNLFAGGRRGRGQLLPQL